MTAGTAGKSFMGPLLAVNLVMYIIVLGLAGWSLDKYINGENHPRKLKPHTNVQNFFSLLDLLIDTRDGYPDLRGNPSTSYLLVFSLLAAVIGVCSVLAGYLHLRTWGSASLAAAASSALVSWTITALAFGLTCKQIGIGNRGRRLRTLEAFIVILTISQLIYLILLHAGIIDRKYGPGYRNYGSEYGGLTQNVKETSTPAVI
ncbi:hypothetical protein H6P81_002586 [Aristolochia fimbriata]|uniref:AWPM-19-like family protein n=1 Tax=Aristolochia fimbriata TaxID=158543 RepID=A0AAV7FAE6_ARIFI|nr:hypothetical protein H6P81_002586 [Aristolochia fimbriata]